MICRKLEYTAGGKAVSQIIQSSLMKKEFYMTGEIDEVQNSQLDRSICLFLKFDPKRTLRMELYHTWVIGKDWCAN